MSQAGLLPPVRFTGWERLEIPQKTSFGCLNSIFFFFAFSFLHEQGILINLNLQLRHDMSNAQSEGLCFAEVSIGSPFLVSFNLNLSSGFVFLHVDYA